ncbi:hypothetical protein IGI39_003004 [Enterococcus sp. AZ135]|uniref:hypothetical protein n=1 Tax=unclassified Enterococcus TaxID=2608891 RepID=UPI003F22E89E
MKKNLFLIATMLFILVGLTACGKNTLKGDYTTKINVLFSETTNTLTFEGNKVTEKQDGRITNEGKYKLSDNQLEITLGDYHMTAELAEDKQSFTIKSSDVLGGVGNGLKYTKEDNNK